MRLQDPSNLVSENELSELNQKIDTGILALARDPSKGGSPFYYAWLMTKDHILAYEWKGNEITTAATNGKEYFWNPDFLSSLPYSEVSIVMEHETIHIICDHAGRQGDKEPELWHRVIDLVANGMMIRDWRYSDRGCKLGKNVTTIENCSLGTVINLEHYKKILKREDFPKGICIFGDAQACLRTPEDIYEELLPLFKNQKKKQNKQENKSTDDESDGSGGQEGEGSDDDSNSINDSGFDNHIQEKLSSQELLDELLVAQDRAESIYPGHTPEYLTELLGELTDPTTNLSDYIRMSCLKRTKGGSKNRWKRPRRRSWSIGQYLPSRITHKEHVNWLCLLDTSASMSSDAITEGLSQLKSISAEFNGIVVPCDACVHWDEATEISNVEDIKQTKIVGRGGTLFDEFLTEFPNRVGTDFDIVIIITDGLVNVAPELEPDIDTLWVVAESNAWFSKSNKEFVPPFGEVIHLCPSQI